MRTCLKASPIPPGCISFPCCWSRGELCVTDIAEKVALSQSAISHQLRILKQMDLIKFRREGKNIWYSLADDHVRTILQMGLEHVMHD